MVSVMAALGAMTVRQRQWQVLVAGWPAVA